MTQATISQNIGNDDVTFLRESQVLKLFPISRSQLWAMVKKGDFPAPVKLSKRCSAWRLLDLKEHGQKLTVKNNSDGANQADE